MSEVTAPTCEQLSNGELSGVHREADDSWRHGSYITEIFRRAYDGTYWRANYRLSSDGETNELREGLADIARVYPHEVRTTEYRVNP